MRWPGCPGRWSPAGPGDVATCDPATATGRRDRAVLLLLSRMGCGPGGRRAGLDDIDWRRARSRSAARAAAGTGCRCPPTWARRSSPTCATGARPAPGPDGVHRRPGPPGGAVYRDHHDRHHAATRAGIPGPVHAHRLGTGVTAMLRGGGSLTEIGQALAMPARPRPLFTPRLTPARCARWAVPGPGGRKPHDAGRTPAAGLAGRLPGAAPRAGLRLKTAGRLLGQFVSGSRTAARHDHRRRRPGMGNAPAGGLAGVAVDPATRSAGSPPTCTAPTRRSRFPRPA